MYNYKQHTPNITLSKTKSDIPKCRISNAKDSYDYVKQFFKDDIDIYESFFIVLLSRANITEGFVKISQGGTVSTIVDVKLITKYAIESLAESVIVCHNHPSGNIIPSDSDKAITNKIKIALNYFDIKLIDHIILTSDKYYSFSNNNLI